MQKITNKLYKCTQCGHESTQATNHYGPTWSAGRFNTCTNCPPYKKYPEFGGQTVWECQEKSPYIKIEDLEIGKKYWVENGHWEMTIVDKNQDTVFYKIGYGKKVHEMKFDQNDDYNLTKMYKDE